MSIYEQGVYTSGSAADTAKLAKSLAQSIYTKKLTIYLSGELGAGKTLFTKAFGEALGVKEMIVSPSYALEQRYEDILLHADLFRLPENDAKTLLRHSEEFPGIRIIEWAERSGSTPDTPHIAVQIDETGAEERTIRFSLNDIPLPDDEQIERWRNNACMPDHIRAHCDLVTENAMLACDDLIRRKIFVRREAIRKAAQIHDLLRFVDFKTAPEVSADIEAVWKEYKETYGANHEIAVMKFLIEKGYPELGTIVRTHGAPHMEDAIPKTIDQKVLNYSDKRALHDKRVTVEDRFQDFIVRYGGGKESDAAKAWKQKTLEIERALFPDSVPF